MKTKSEILHQISIEILNLPKLPTPKDRLEAGGRFLVLAIENGAFADNVQLLTFMKMRLAQKLTRENPYPSVWSETVLRLRYGHGPYPRRSPGDKWDLNFEDCQLVAQAIDSEVESIEKQSAEAEPKRIRYPLIPAQEKKSVQPTEASGRDDEAYVSYSKAIEFSNAILTRKILDKAIKQGKPVKVRDKKPSKNRRSVHIQDVLLLINKLSSNEKAADQAARMFGEYKEQLQKKMTGQVNLD